MTHPHRRPPLRRLSYQQLQGAITRMRDAAEAHYDGDHLAWERWEGIYGHTRVRLECPSGEVFTKPLQDWAAAWWWTGAIRIEALTNHDCLNADIEGAGHKAVVDDAFTRVLLAAHELPEDRVAVYVPPELLARLEP